MSNGIKTGNLVANCATKLELSALIKRAMTFGPWTFTKCAMKLVLDLHKMCGKFGSVDIYKTWK